MHWCFSCNRTPWPLTYAYDKRILSDAMPLIDGTATPAKDATMQSETAKDQLHAGPGYPDPD